jgi:hypothetical protein
MTDELLKSFILYTQALETAYHEWKSYWLNYYMSSSKQTKGLYEGFDTTIFTKWLESPTLDKNTSNY